MSRIVSRVVNHAMNRVVNQGVSQGVSRVMSRRADEAVVRRDSVLPGLGVLLDPERFVETLGRALPDSTLSDPELTYLRYKPTTNCLAGYRLKVNGEEAHIYAKAHRLDDAAKLRKAAQVAEASGGPEARIALAPDLATVAYRFPYDRSLTSLRRLYEPEQRASLLSRLLPPDLAADAELVTLRYKAERRFVGRVEVLGRPRAVIKLYDRHTFGRASRGAKAFSHRAAPRVAPCLASSDRHRAVATGWVAGEPLAEALSHPALGPSGAFDAGRSLAALHASDAPSLPALRREQEVVSLLAAASAAAFYLPSLAGRSRALALELCSRLLAEPQLPRPIHGDFSADQVVVTPEGAVLLDFDEAARGDPAADIGTFTAQLERDRLTGRLQRGSAEHAAHQLLAGYGSEPPRTWLYQAAGLLRLAPHAFRSRDADWPEQIGALLEAAERAVARHDASETASVPPR